MLDGKFMVNYSDIKKLFYYLKDVICKEDEDRYNPIILYIDEDRINDIDDYYNYVFSYSVKFYYHWKNCLKDNDSSLVYKLKNSILTLNLLFAIYYTDRKNFLFDKVYKVLNKKTLPYNFAEELVNYFFLNEDRLRILKNFLFTKK